MKKLASALAAIALSIGLATPAAAQEQEKSYLTYPHMFVGLQGGVETTLSGCSIFDVMRPTGAVSFGAYFTRVVGTRLHVNGIWNRGKLDDGFKYDYKYATADIDLLLNVTNLFRKGDDHLVNLILIGGVGLNTAWDNKQLNNATAHNAGLPYMWDGKRLSHNARVGLQLNLNCSKLIDVNFEVNANSLSDRYNSRMENRDDWQFTAMAGIAFKFGYKKRPVIAPVVLPEVWETRVDTTWYDDVKYVEEPMQESITFNIKYPLRGVAAGAPAKDADDVVEFVKTHKDVKVDIVGYADKGTGNPRINMKYSQQRAENLRDALISKGVPAEIITTSWKGDTVQPFADNDANRVAVTVVTGTGSKKKEVKERKFKTNEVRYRVQ